MESQSVKRISEPTDIQTAISQARKRFSKDESGAVLLFSLILFVLMIMIGGLAVDLMRYESTRTTLQNTLDRSTLAAAGLSQTLDAEAVVRDHVDKVGMTQDLTSVTVTQGLNFKTVNATALADTAPIFLHMIGIDSFDAPAVATAEQRITNVEIALVLDVSGSMQGTKIVNLKSAASEFVDTVLSSDGDDRISVALVPYNGQVNLGPTMAAQYNVTLPTGVANTQCVDLPSSVYSTTSMSDGLELPTTAYADSFSGTSQSTSYVAASSSGPVLTNMWCPSSNANFVRPPNNDIGVLQGQINGLNAVGATSINAGMKWGLALLDPAARPMFEDLANDGTIPDAFDVRPFEYDDDEALKVIVLMTDGSHFAEERMKAAYKDGMSQIYKGTDNYYSIKHTTGRPTAAGTNQFFVPHLCTSTNCRNGTNTAEAWKSSAHSSGVQMAWTTVWKELRVSYVAWQLYARALGISSTTRTNTYNTWMSNFRTQTPTGDMDSQLQSICGQAKTKKNVVIYGIAFDAPTAGAQQIKMCTTGYDPAYPNDTNAYYFAASPTNIRTAFRAIATNISQLRLTQ